MGGCLTEWVGGGQAWQAHAAAAGTLHPPSLCGMPASPHSLQPSTWLPCSPPPLPPWPVGQVSRLKRELASLEEARGRSREEAQRSEQARMALEAELKVGGGR